MTTDTLDEDLLAELTPVKQCAWAKFLTTLPEATANTCELALKNPEISVSRLLTTLKNRGFTTPYRETVHKHVNGSCPCRERK